MKDRWKGIGDGGLTQIGLSIFAVCVASVALWSTTPAAILGYLALAAIIAALAWTDFLP